jgi:hypothetical protein
VVTPAVDPTPLGQITAGRAGQDWLRLEVQLSEALTKSPAWMPVFALLSRTIAETKNATFS